MFFPDSPGFGALTVGVLLLESGSTMLLESGSDLLLEDGGDVAPTEFGYVCLTVVAPSVTLTVSRNC